MARLRPDVGAYFGARFTIRLQPGRLVAAAGTYDIVVYAHSAVTASFDAAQLVRVSVR